MGRNWTDEQAAEQLAAVAKSHAADPQAALQLAEALACDALVAAGWCDTAGRFEAIRQTMWERI